MNFIKKIYDGKKDSWTHNQFQKFSKGIFPDKASFIIKKSKEDYKISTTYEFANEFVYYFAEKLGEKKVEMSGAIISTSDIKNLIDFKEIKQFQGVKRYIIDSEISGNEIKNLVEKIPKAFFGLSFEEKGVFSLKIKPKSPKSKKPNSKKQEKIKPDFCKIVTKDKNLVNSFVFEKNDFKNAEIVHTFIIEDIIIPNELKNTEDYLKIREESLRKGKIIRNSQIDGEKIVKEISFQA